MFDAIPFDRRSCAEALPDYLSIVGGFPPADPDPIGEALATRRGGIPFPELACHVAGVPFGRGELARALTSSDLGDALEKAGTAVAGVAYDEQRAELAPVIFDAPARGIRAVEMPLLDLGEINQVPAVGSVPLSLGEIATATVERPALFAGRFLLSRDAIEGNDIGLAAQVTRQLGGMPARIEARLAGEALEAASIEATTATGLDVASIREALATLRTRETDAGNVANLRGQYLICPPSAEAAAWILRESMGRRFDVIVNAWVDAAFMLCPPAQAAVLARPVPVGLDGRPSVMRSAAVDRDPETGSDVHYDGIGFRVEAYVGVSVVATVGAVKIALS